MLKKVFLLLFVLASSVQAKDYAEHQLAEEFIAEMASGYGFNQQAVREVLLKANKQQNILDAISRPAERVKPWKEYRPIFLTQQRIDGGIKFWQDNLAALNKAEQEYGVPAEIITAIIGVETMYGSNTGRYLVLDALATLSFDYPPRSEFFRSQLREFFLLLREEQLDATELTGSYAGAMGMPQFMPGSFRAYAVDFNADGKVDIWSDATDAIGSVANYFIAHGWQPGEEIALKATLTNDSAVEYLTQGLAPKNNLEQLLKNGWQLNQETKATKDTKVTAFQLDGENGVEYWIGLPNFQAITKYNRSEMYAMAVTQLASALAAEFKSKSL